MRVADVLEKENIEKGRREGVERGIVAMAEECRELGAARIFCIKSAKEMPLVNNIL